MHSLEFEQNGTTVVWENLTVNVSPQDGGSLGKLCGKFAGSTPAETVTILKGVSGYATTGRLIAIMGASGAGKTTFLAALARRIELARGTVKMNGQVLSRGIMSKISCYMSQFDALPGFLTAEEYIVFAHALKANSTGARRQFLCEKLLTELSLFDCRNVLISNLSGGEKKRLSLATELVTKPLILFLDEPTTGLDTFSAMQVVESLKLVSLETIVFCTIHQPGMAIYNLFTHAIFMTDGRLAYSGSLENATDFFSSQGYECPTGFDESEFYIKILSAQPAVLVGSTSDRVAEICEAFSLSSLSAIPSFEGKGTVDIEPQKKAGTVKQFYWLTWRIWLQNRRTLFTDWTPWLSYFLSVAVVGTFYYGINPRTQEGVQNTRGALYMMSSEIIFTVAYSVIYEFPGELMVYRRENSVYECGPYYASTFLGLMPKTILKALLFTVVLYFVVNQEAEFVNFFYYCLCTTAAAVCGTAYGVMFSSWIESVEIATTIMVPIDMLFLITAGVFYNLRSLPGYLAYFKYLSLFFYVNEALSTIYWTPIQEIECETESDLPCLSNGQDVLAEFGYDRSNFFWDLSGLAMLTILMLFAGYFGVRRRRMVKTMF